jgi:N-acetylglucosaminyl-diphospho-decaprenol L-rhamnosyltransferase
MRSGAPPPLECEVAAVAVALRDSPRLRQALASTRRAAGGRDLATVCVINDPSAVGWGEEDGVRFVGAGMNLGWAAGVHAGLIGVRSDYVWAIQDDLTVGADALDRLAAALEADPGLGSVRPISVDEQGRVDEGTCGGSVDDAGRWSAPIPRRSIPASSAATLPVGGYLPSSGQLIRRRAWDAVGGFDPWFYPWGYIDIDFGRTLTRGGWRFAHVASAHMRHATRGSTTALFRWLCSARNQALFAAKWADEGAGPSAMPSIAPASAIIASAREGRARPREVDLDALRQIAGVAAADLGVAAMRWSSLSAMGRAARLAATDAPTRRATAAKFGRAARRAARR